MRRCVITLATGDGRYAAGLRALERSLEQTRFDGSLLSWRELPSGCPPHWQVPFAFKPYCFSEAKEQGFDSVLWLDSSCAALRPLDVLFGQIEVEGHLLFRNRSYRVGEWASDRALEVLGLSREEAMEIPEVNAAAIGLDLRRAPAREFLEQWLAAARSEIAFRGIDEPIETSADYQAVKWNHEGRVSADARVRGHRHDQTVAGVLAHRLGLRLTTGGIRVAGADRWPRAHGAVILLDRQRRPSRASRLARRARLLLRRGSAESTGLVP